MIVILDTGCANLRSLFNAVKRLGKEPVVTKDLATIKSARRVFLPGVGTAGAAMSQIQARDLTATLQELTQPVMGICLGMQLLTRFSSESDVNCLGLIDAQVRELAAPRLPHMGWNQLTHIKANPIFDGIDENDWFYFVHSFIAPLGPYTLAQSQHGEAFSAVIAQDNVIGAQFHPERSGKSGALMLKNFLEKEPC
ncbi:imidazole glycerol phosphate synthase subunit HisH [Gallaecimonas xiamenensis]|uniref:Imidazole glycerol phosphate synthase subunit HisH n=1 Tax=Gallaecimonas xiamenensis 3-C-1 TaxID=745411 RepID=K2IGA2_9GAMM|nr:imidazole glycerol phosphate synthase subunit HisH [Gallaecimonas xiamenensis]EKE69106.1 imidazole glycerol phosphate synthase subunit HisH [Gallaecimonas xiamenensis 3-C-1]